MKPETIAAHIGHQPDPTSGAIAPPIVLSTTYERATDGSFPSGFIYSRSGNPNRLAVEQALAALEGGAEAAAFASGQAATMSVVHALQSGDHLIAPQDLYYGTRLLIESLYGRWGLASSFVDMTDLEAVRRTMRPNTRLLWVETPSNPLLKVSDIAALAEIAHAAGALCVCDNTWATPIFQRPLELGADLVMHSTTKYLGGHSDLTGGCIITQAPSEFFQRVRLFQTTGGAVPSPFDCWLLLRSLPTLPHRMPVHAANALRIAHFLQAHPRVEAVHYPGLTSHAGHLLARQQMRAFGGMLSFQVSGGKDEALAVVSRVKLFTRATSLGSYESLIEHRASIEGPTSTTPQNLLRLSIGLEHADDLIEDLKQALEP